MSLPSTPDIKIKEEEPVEVDSSPPDSPVASPQSPQAKEKVSFRELSFHLFLMAFTHFLNLYLKKPRLLSEMADMCSLSFMVILA